MNEVEATLVIGADAPQDIVGKLCEVTSAGGYRLLPRPAIPIHDTYMDTASHHLNAAGLSFRLRQVGTTTWTTLKGPPRRLGPGIVERLEIEALWSDDSLPAARRELAKRGINLADRPGEEAGANPGGSSPLQSMSRLGLQAVQRRDNYRAIRDVVAAGGADSPVLAELAIDSVVYLLDRRQVRHYEVEIEAKGAGGPQALRAVALDLAARYAPALRSWNHGKLSTGSAINDLLESEGPQGMLNANNELLPAAYDKIHRLLSSTIAGRP